MPLESMVRMKANECALAISATSDRSRREGLVQMQSIWIALADAVLGPNDHRLIAGVARIHDEVARNLHDDP
jgi:hypothetical protein